MKNNSRKGLYISCSTSGEHYKAYIPPPLPPNPALKLEERHFFLLAHASCELGRLDGMSRFFPDKELFLYSFVRKEALLSSQIEGTQSSFSDLLLFEDERSPGVPREDVEEVSNYVKALNYGLKKIRQDFPLSLRLFKEIHEKLLQGVRGHNKTPGEFRRSQNWLGGTRPGNAIFVPPPPQQMEECMNLVEKFLHQDEVQIPTLIKAALFHVQFETIHPFLDGNGRLGRLLITLLLCAEGLLKEPMLYLSLFFKQHRGEYYRHLQEVRAEGAWENWIEFFLEAVWKSSLAGQKMASDMLSLFSKDKNKIESLGRIAGNILRIHDYLTKKPLLTIPETCIKLQLTKPTVGAAIQHLLKLGIVEEISGRQRDKIFVYKKYLKILNEGAEPLPK